MEERVTLTGEVAGTVIVDVGLLEGFVDIPGDTGDVGLEACVVAEVGNVDGINVDRASQSADVWCLQSSTMSEVIPIQ